MIDIGYGMACGVWMELSASGLKVLRGANDAQMSVDEIKVTPRQFAAMSRTELWMAGVEFQEVPTQHPRPPVPYWRGVMREWNMDPTKTYQTFNGMLPTAVARRVGVIESCRATFS